jgi:hypothetical protein
MNKVYLQKVCCITEYFFVKAQLTGFLHPIKDSSILIMFFVKCLRKEPKKTSTQNGRCFLF